MTPTADTPALADLDANTLESYRHIVRRLVESRDAVPFDSFQYVTAKRAYEATFGGYSDAPLRVAQLVVAARAGLEDTARLDRVLASRVWFQGRAVNVSAGPVTSREQLDAYIEMYDGATLTPERHA